MNWFELKRKYNLWVLVAFPSFDLRGGFYSLLFPFQTLLVLPTFLLLHCLFNNAALIYLVDDTWNHDGNKQH